MTEVDRTKLLDTLLQVIEEEVRGIRSRVIGRVRALLPDLRVCDADTGPLLIAMYPPRAPHRKGDRLPRVDLTKRRLHVALAHVTFEYDTGMDP